MEIDFRIDFGAQYCVLDMPTLTGVFGIMARRQLSKAKAPYSAPGVFPRPGLMQFIDRERIDAAIRRPLVADPTAPLAMGVAIASAIQDRTVIRFRRGRDARSIAAVKFYLPSRTQTASRIMEQVALHKPAVVSIDATSIGWAVHDRLAQLGCPHLLGVGFGRRADSGAVCSAAADDDVRYADKRTELWGLMKDWCNAGCLPDDADLAADLSAVEYGYDAGDAILLERKDDMRRRGLVAPDDGDALALTFAYALAQRDSADQRRSEESIRRLRR
jgi:hypothetical protein